ncbi:CIR protein [Plasmodium chabaudi chabaudi]|uniref:CIR protein n=2 Tax=Plasmodium chabaudi chabaudi TaxID=31271 RepID=A0A1C6WNE2_PLACU|nr:CIR protein [Plasmodium chabaudi chabaudi]
MSYSQVCNLFNGLDELFIENPVDEDNFNAFSTLYNDYCPQDKNGDKKCITDYDRISAVAGYLFMEFVGENNIDISSDNNYNIQYFIMWISSKLYEIATKNYESLNQPYENNLDKSIGNFDFLNNGDNTKELKDYDITIMNMFYLLFREICEAVWMDQGKTTKVYEHTKKITQCFIIYTELSKFVYPCSPYLELLDHLKQIYDDYRETAIKKQIHGQYTSNILRDFPQIDKAAQKFNFKSLECKKVHEQLTKNAQKLIKKEKEKKEGKGKTEKKEKRNGYDYEEEEEEEEQDDDELSSLLKLLTSGDDNNKESGNVKSQDMKLEKRNESKGSQSASQGSAKSDPYTTVTQKQDSGSASRGITVQSGKTPTPTPAAKPVDKKSAVKKTVTTKPAPPQTAAAKPAPAKPAPAKPEDSKSPSAQIPPAPAKPAPAKPAPAKPAPVKPAAPPKAQPKPETRQKTQQTQHTQQLPSASLPSTEFVTSNPPNANTSNETSETRSTGPNSSTSTKTPTEHPPPPSEKPSIGQQKGASLKRAQSEESPQRQKETKPLSQKSVTPQKEQQRQEKKHHTHPKTDKLPLTQSQQSSKTLSSTESKTSTTPPLPAKPADSKSAATTSQPNQPPKTLPSTTPGTVTTPSRVIPSVTKTMEPSVKPTQGHQMQIQQRTPPHSASLYASQKSGSSHQSGIKNSESGSDVSKNGKNGLWSRKGNGDDGFNGSGSSDGKSKDGAPKKIDRVNISTPGPKSSSTATALENQGNVSGIAQTPAEPTTNLSPTASGTITSTSTTTIVSIPTTSLETMTISMPTESSHGQSPSAQSVLQRQQQISPTLSSTTSGTITTPTKTTTVSTGEAATAAMSSIKSTMPGQNGDSKGSARVKRSPDPGSSISTPTNGLGATSDTSPSSTTSITLSSSVPRTITIEPITANVSEGENAKSDISSIENTLHSQDDIPKQLSRRKRSSVPESSISISSSGQGATSDASSSITVTDVKINEKSSIWCIGSNKKCNIIGIGIIGISIFVFLAFMFKYLSFGSKKKSKKKKITKKVINLVDGRKMEKTFIKSIDREKKSKIIINPGDNKKIAKIIMNSDDTNKPIKMEINPWDEKRETHITINSEHTKKYTKSVINSGDRKKTKIVVNSVNEKISLLNIYKFMKADPMPFINLFFLLIFFVYKRKRSTIE